MNNSFTLKKQSNSYQRWQMNAFDAVDLPAEIPPEIPVETPKGQEASEAPEVSSEVPKNDSSKTDSTAAGLPSEEELTEISAQAKDQGYSVGYEEGKKSGYKEGHEEGHVAGYAEGRSLAEKEVKEEVAQIQTLLTSFSQNLDEMSEVVAKELLDLAITISKKMITHAFAVKPELIVPIVCEAMSQLPHSMHHPILYLHPDDLKIIRTHLDNELTKENWSIREDNEITRGGCRIVTESSEINGTVEMRWEKILSAMGQQNNWME